jgi:hypothetical protein
MKKWLIGLGVYAEDIELEVLDSLSGYEVELVEYVDLFKRDYKLSEFNFYGSLEQYKRLGGDLSKFSYSYWSRLVDRVELINSEYELVKVRDLVIDRDAFIKSDSGEKLFSGEVCTVNDYKARVEFYKLDRLRDEDKLVVCYSIKDIREEYRSFIYNGEVIDLCCYKSSMGSVVDVGRVKEYIDRLDLSLLSMELGEYFILDIGCLADKRLGVLEVNCFHTSGLYDMDYKKIFKMVSAK